MIRSLAARVPVLPLLCSAWLLAPAMTDAQTPAERAPAERVMAGTVVDAASRAPIAGAEIAVETKRVVTDAAGRFSVRVPIGPVDIVVTAAGHFPLATTLDRTAGDVAAVELALARDTGFATSVDVVAAAPTASPAAETVQPVQVLRTPGALDNVYRTLQTLPGVAATEEFGSRLSVRGGAPDQNLTVMDGVEVHDPYRLFGLTSAFNPETIERFELATGGFSAKYGDRLSSLLVVENRDGRAGAGLSGSAALSITDANLVFEGGLPGRAKGSWLVTGRRTYYDLVAERVTDQQFPGFADVQARATWAPWTGGRVTAFSLTSRQSAALDIDEDTARGEFQDDTDNDLAWARIDATIGTRGQSHTVFGYSNTRSTFGVDASFQNKGQRSNAPGDDAIGVANVVFERALTVRDLSIRHELAWALGAHVVEAGVEAHRLSTGQRFEVTGDRNPTAVNGSSVQGGAGLPDLLVSSTRAGRGGAWLQDSWQVGGRASLQAGLRLDRAGVTRETLLSPRLSGAFAATGSTRVLAAVGRYTQSPGYEKQAQADYVLDITGETARALVSERAWHASAGIERELGRGVTAKIEGYYKRFTDMLIGRLETSAERTARLSRYDFPADLRWSLPVDPVITTVPVNDGRGRAYGVDVFVERPGGRLSGWTSYTLGRAEREAYGLRYPFEYDRRHAFTMVSAFRLTPRWELAATTRVASGFPRTAPVGVRVAGQEDALDRDGDGVTDEILPARDARGLLEYGVDFGPLANLNRARLPFFARVDGRLTWRPRGANGRWELYAEVINVLNRQNAGALDPQLAYDAASDRPAIVEKRDQAIPRLPTIGLRFRF